jgi:hypothetical protein
MPTAATLAPALPLRRVLALGAALALAVACSDNGPAPTTTSPSAGGSSVGSGGRGIGTGGTAGGTAPGDGGAAGVGTGGDDGVGGATGGDGGAGGSTNGDASAPPPDVAHEAAVPPAVDSVIVINELMASNALTSKDETGKTTDWIELYNPGTSDVPLGGYAFTDDFAMPLKAPLPDGLVLPAGGHLIIWFDGVAGGGRGHVPIKLVSTGGSLGFSRPDGSFIAKLTYGAQETDFSATREPDGSDAWVIEWHPSPGAANPKGAGKALTASAAVAPEIVPPAGDLTEKILGYDVINQLRIDVDADGASKLRANPLMDVPATLVFDGRAYGPVGVRLKGHNSFEPFDQKPSIKVAVDKYVPNAKFFGLNDLTLNNMHSDPSMMHERMAYWVARSVGVPASRAAHMMVSVNGAAPSLYIAVETIKHKMMTRLFKMPEGSLYEGFNVDFTRMDTDYMPPRDDVPFFDLKGKIDDRSLLAGLADATGMKPADQAIAAAGNFMNMPEYLAYWGVCSVIGQFDSMPYSIPGDDFYVYSNPEDHKLQVLPWGMDETFEASDVDLIKRPYSVLARTCLASAACKQQYVDASWSLLAKVETLGWLQEHDRVAKQIAPYTVMDKRKSYSDGMVTTGQQDMRFFIADRRMWFTKFLPPASK